MPKKRAWRQATLFCLNLYRPAESAINRGSDSEKSLWASLQSPENLAQRMYEMEASNKPRKNGS